MELRERLRERIAALVGAEPAAGRAHDEHDRRLQHRPRRARARPGRRDRDDDGRALRLARGARDVGRAGRRRGARPDAIRAAVTPRTRLLALSQVTWTTGRILPVRELREETGIPMLVDGAQSVGAIPVAAAGLDYLTISGQKWLCGPDATGALVVADPDRLRISAPSYFSQAEYEPDGQFRPKPGAARFDPGWWPPSSLAGLLAALDSRPSWAFDHAAAVAERCRELLAEQVEVVGPAPTERSTLVAFRARGDTGAVVESLYDDGVHVREIPGTGLIRVSCGWWTSDGTSTGCWPRCRHEPPRRVPLRSGAVLDRRPRAGRDRLPL